MKNNLFIIAQSGWSYVAAAFGVFVVFAAFEWSFLAFLSFLFMALFVYLFRNPERESVHFEEHAIVSPVDGEVLGIVTLEDSSEYAFRVDIKSSYKDLAILRSPLNAVSVKHTHTKGARLSEESRLFEDLSERGEIIFEGAFAKVKVLHRVTQSFAPLFIDIDKNEKLYMGSRYGVMLCGITSIYLPSNVRLDLAPSQQLEASVTLLGYSS